MKNIFLLIFLLPILCFSQSAENDALMLTYLNYTGGQYHLSIVNKQPCEADIMLNWNNRGKDSVVSIAGKSTMKLHIPTDYIVNSIIKVKANKTCAAGGGWISIVVPELAILPVHLLEFTAVKTLDQVKLHYSLSFTGGFPFAVLERSSDSKRWTALHTVVSDMEHEYIDKYPEAGTNYYRLKLVDAGSITYSNILMVSMNKDAIERLKVYDLNGRYYNEIKASNTVEAKIALNRFPKGIYLLTTNTNASWKVCNY